MEYTDLYFSFANESEADSLLPMDSYPNMIQWFEEDVVWRSVRLPHGESVRPEHSDILQTLPPEDQMNVWMCEESDGL